ncbi:MAG: hypothetical protein SFW36_10845 [Leptolyngbyaceae cyanobacterium bins.59]|nr:hypothetical protein [Leptolyngbyaceae cyanobacterium bins.59]
MAQTVTSHDYPNLGVFEGHSVLTRRLITMGRVVECSKGFLPQIKSHNKWINVSSSLPSLEEARDFLFNRHYLEAQQKRQWSDEELQKQISKVQEKNLQLWSSRLQKRIELQRQLNANLDGVRRQAVNLLENPKTQSLSARKLTQLIVPLCQRVFFPYWETTKGGLLRTLENLLKYCDDPDLQEEQLNRLSEID